MKDLLMPWTCLPTIFRRLMGTFEQLLDKGYAALAIVLLSVLVFWHIYTPVHELLHVAACLMGGGTVETLALKPQYGGTLLQPIFPFIVPESDYAGQLTGFTTPNDFVYFFVDMLPYVLSLFGLALIDYVQRTGRTWLFGLAVILCLIPLMSIPGDYYEAASLLTTRIAHAIDPALPARVLLSDDVFKSIGDLSEQGMLSPVNMVLIIVGILLAIWMALFTLALEVKIADRLLGKDNKGKDSQPPVEKQTA